jgi:hypothetical protein
MRCSSVWQRVLPLLAFGFSSLGTNVALAGFIVNPGTDFGGGGVVTNPSLSTLALTLYAPKTRNPIASTAFTATWYTAAGAVAGTTTFTTDASGGFKVPPPAIPAGALPNGGYVDLVGGPYGAGAPLRVSWYRTGWSYLGVSNGIHPLGLPGVTPLQSWSFINPTDTSGTLPLPSQLFGGTLSATVIASNFDLSYTPTGPGSYEATITGDNSYMQLVNSAFLSTPELADNAFVQFPAGTDFGSLLYLTSTSGTFNFSAMGISGTWTYDLGTNFTTGTITSRTAFQADAVAGTQVPEPQTLALVLLGVTVLIVVRKRCKTA